MNDFGSRRKNEKNEVHAEVSKVHDWIIYKRKNQERKFLHFSVSLFFLLQQILSFECLFEDPMQIIIETRSPLIVSTN